LKNKLFDLTFLLNKQLVDILVINETKADQYDDDSLFSFNNNYVMLRRDRLTDGGGGIIVYVHSKLNLSCINNDNKFEIISFKIKISNDCQIGVVASYRPPNTNRDDFLKRLEKKLPQFDNLANTIIIGDLNFDMFDATESKKLADFSLTNGFSNVIKKGTRLNPVTFAITLLDVMLCLSLSLFVASEVIKYPYSDHWLTISVFNHKSSLFKAAKISSRCLNSKKLEKIKSSLKKAFKNIKLKNCLLNVNEHGLEIKNLIKCIIDEIAPLKAMNVRTRNLVPWYDTELVRLANSRDSLYNKALNSK
jgi:hypothetical protein